EEIALDIMKINGWALERLHQTPVVGDRLVRALMRGAARAAFHLPALGGKRSTDIWQVKRQWMAFLGRAGLHPKVTAENKREFFWEVDACPYGFDCQGQVGVCDAAMDLDRTYTRLLGGELTILERIPAGSAHCRYVTRLARN
ncbi:MAG: hypothetical protein ABIJ95_12365, partial [Pseudomonadota bacterium]